MTSPVRFPPSELTGLIDERPRYNLASSYGPDLSWADLVELGALDVLRDLSIGYGTSRGGERLRAAIAGTVGVRPDDVIATTGAAGALFLASFALAGPGDEVVTVVPNFPPTMEAIDASGATRRLVRLSFDEGYRLPLDGLADALSERTALVVLTSPGNPSGVSFTRAELEPALRLIRDRAPRAHILVDETFRRASYGTAERLPSVASWDDRVMVSESLSKCHGAPGLRIGWLVCRDESLRRRFGAVKMGTVVACGTIDEALAALILEREAEVVGRHRAALAAGLDILAAWVDASRSWIEWVRPDAGALCSLRFRVGDEVVAHARRGFAARGVKVAPGSMFGDDPRTFRIGFGGLPAAALREGLDAMSAALAEATGRAA